MYSLRFSILLLLILIIPFLLRKRAMELYPAVLMPDGATTLIQADGRVKVEYKTVSGRDASGKWTNIDPVRFLYPIPVQYLPAILSRDLGATFDSSKVMTKKFKLLERMHLAWKPVITDEELRERNRWLKMKLAEQGIQASQIKITSYEENISSTDGKILSKKEKNEKIIDLTK